MLRKILLASRYLMVLPIIGALFLTISVVISGLSLVVVEEWKLLQQGEYSARSAKQLTLTVIEAIDMFLVGAISYIIAVGFYILFISQEEEHSLKRFKIKSLADLETKVIGVAAVALAVGFVGKASEFPGPDAVLKVGGGVAAVIIALCLFLKFSSSGEDQQSQ